MKIRVRFFGSFRDLAGREIEMAIEERLEVGDVIHLLQERIEGFTRDFTEETLIVLNDRVVLRNRGDIEAKPVRDGDVIGIFPPVSGGENHQEPASGAVGAQWETMPVRT